MGLASWPHLLKIKNVLSFCLDTLIITSPMGEITQNSLFKRPQIETQSKCMWDFCLLILHQPLRQCFISTYRSRATTSRSQLVPSPQGFKHTFLKIIWWLNKFDRVSWTNYGKRQYKGCNTNECLAKVAKIVKPRKLS